MYGGNLLMKKLLALVVLGIAIPAAALAQSAVTGAITGVVSDPTGAVVPSAAVTLLNNGTNKEEMVTAESDGRFRFNNLEPGSYTLTIKTSGFADYKKPVLVEVGRVVTVEAALNVGNAQTEVSVVEDLPLVNTATREFASNINQTTINELPVNGRRWSNFVMLTPGVVPDGSFGLLSFRGISGLLNNNTVDGGDNNQAFFGEERGRTRISYSISQSAIQEFQVNTSNYSAEYGRAAGGVTNAVTKSGTNDVHGDIFYFQRNNAWGARNPLAFQSVLQSDGSTQRVGIKPDDVRHQFGGTIGGPIQKDKLFYFFSYDQQRRNFPGLGIFTSPSYLSTVNRAQLTAAPRNLTDGQINDTLGFINSLTGQVPRRGDQLLLLPKLDWHPNDKNTLTVNYNRLRWNSPAGIQTQPTNTLGRASFGDDFVKIDWGTARLVTTVSPTMLNEFRFQYARDFEFENSQTPLPGEPRTALSGSAPDVFLTNGLEFGKPTFLERKKYPEEKRVQLTDSFTVAMGANTLKFGVDINHVNDVLSNMRFESGSYSYSNINDFIVDYVNWKTPLAPTAACVTTTRIAGHCYTSNFQQAFGQPEARFSTNDYSLFAQYDWKPSQRLTVNAGLRYEYQAMPPIQAASPANDIIPNTGGLTLNKATSQLPNDKKDIGPRVGLAYDVTGDGKTAIRGGYGLYFGRTINSTIYNALINTGATGGISQTSISLAPTATTAPVFPFVLSSAPAGSGAIQYFAPGYRNAMIHEIDLTAERQIMRHTLLAVSYLSSLGRRLPSFYDRNLSAPTSTQTYTVSGGPYDGQTVTVPAFRGARPNPNYGALTEIVSKVNSTYNAMAIQLNRQLSDGLQFQFNYTLSKATDTLQTSTTFTTTNVPTNVFDPNADEGRSGFDRRHKFVANIVWSPRVKSDNKTLKALADGWTLAPVVQFFSGIPIDAGVSGSMPNASPADPTILSSTSSGINGSGGKNRLTISPRNVFSGPNVWYADLRLSRRFYIREKMNVEALVEGFNIFNRTQFTNGNGTAYSISGTAQAAVLTYQPTFQSISEAGTGFLTRERQIQIGARFHF
jgi:hypothetical protein